jgi:hypothetical protein
VGIIAVNFPVIKPFFNRAKIALSSVKPSQEHSSNALPDSLRLSHVERHGKKRTVHEITRLDTTCNESEEHIVRKRDSEVRADSEISVGEGRIEAYTR